MKILKRVIAGSFVVIALFLYFHFTDDSSQHVAVPERFICPIKYSRHILIRNDDMGEGHFGAPRRGRLHKGVDLLAEVGEAVYASKSGRVVVRNDPNGYGRYIKIYHPGGFLTLYAHLLDVCVKTGQKVSQEQVIGTIGRSGNARYKGIKTHLHFEIRAGDTAVDPMGLITK